MCCKGLYRPCSRWLRRPRSCHEKLTWNNAECEHACMEGRKGGEASFPGSLPSYISCTETTKLWDGKTRNTHPCIYIYTVIAGKAGKKKGDFLPWLFTFLHLLHEKGLFRVAPCSRRLRGCRHRGIKSRKQTDAAGFRELRALNLVDCECEKQNWRSG